MRLFQESRKKPEVLGDDTRPSPFPKDVYFVRLKQVPEDIGYRRALQSKVRTIACLFLIVPIMCLMLTLLASAVLLLSHSKPTCQETDLDWKEHVLRYFAEHDSRAACAAIADVQKIDCFPVGTPNQEGCLKRKCCWSPAQSKSSLRINTPWCYYPTKYRGYVSDAPVNTSMGFKVAMHRKFKSQFPKDVQMIEMDVRMESPACVRVKITDPKTKRFETPYPEVPTFNEQEASEQEASLPMYTVQVNKGSSGFNVVRKATNQSIFTAMDVGDLVFSDQFLEISAHLPKGSSIYGLGEHQGPLKINNNNDWHVITMWNHDGPPRENVNLYGTHPFYLAVEPSGYSHGFFLLNSNAMDFIVSPNPSVTIRTIGGILDMYFFMGPTPEDVVSQYSEIVGPAIMPPFWALGYHQCKYDYGSLERTKQIWKQTRDAGIPFDTQWNDIDYMDKYNDFTYDKNKFADLPAFVKQLHDVGMHYVPILDPGVSAAEAPGTYPPYDEGIKRDIFVKTDDGKPFVGKVWNLVSTAFPDFTNPMTIQYWTDMVRILHNQVPFDGLWIDMNEPSNFYNGLLKGCPNSTLETPEYVPHVENGLLILKTLCMTAKQFAGNHYDVHNLYGMTEGIATNAALTQVLGKRPFIISRSTFAGHGKFASHWSGDVFSTWYDMKMSIPQMLSFNMFQIPMIGADICGFNGNTTQALCNRWVQLGAFYPFSRNHNTNDAIDQDPVSMGDMVVQSAKKALTARYRLHPYLYSLFFLAHKTGSTVARPLFFEFTKDPNTLAIDEQFMWGSYLLINPVLKENDTEVSAYLPKGIWYDFDVESGRKYVSAGEKMTLPAPLDTIPVLVRGGGILPLQKPELTTTLQRTKPFELLVAPDEESSAIGFLYWDDGETLRTIEDGRYALINFEMQKNSVRGAPQLLGFLLPNLDRITVLNVAKNPAQVKMNGIAIKTYEYQPKAQILIVNCNLDLKIPFILEWTQ